MDKFIIKGLCDKCGELLGTLKSIDPFSLSENKLIYLNDRVMYHVAPTMTKAVMKCPT